MLPRALDRLLDAAVVPGFTSAGYRLRSGGFAASRLPRTRERESDRRCLWQECERPSGERL